MPVALAKKAITIGVFAVLVASTVGVTYLWRRGSCVEFFADGTEKTLYGRDCELLLALYTAEENQGLNSTPREPLEVLRYPATAPRSFEASLNDTSELSVFPQHRPQKLKIRRLTRGNRPKLKFKATVARALTKKITPSNARVKALALRGHPLRNWASRKYGYGDNEV